MDKFSNWLCTSLDKHAFLCTRKLHTRLPIPSAHVTILSKINLATHKEQTLEL